MIAWLVRMEGYLKGWGKADGDSTCNSGASEKLNPLEMAFHHHLPHQNLAPSFLLPPPLPPPAALQQPGNSLVPETALQPVSSHHHHYHNNNKQEQNKTPHCKSTAKGQKNQKNTHTQYSDSQKKRMYKTQNTKHNLQIFFLLLLLLLLLDNRRVPKNKKKPTKKGRKKKRSRAAAAKETEREREQQK
jgi:hypothetical protein